MISSNNGKYFCEIKKINLLKQITLHIFLPFKSSCTMDHKFGRFILKINVRCFN